SGLSATTSREDRRTTQIIGQGIAAGGVTTQLNGLFIPGLSAAPNVGLINGGPGAAAINTGLGYGGWQAPDIVGNLRVDQAWGSAQVGAAAHQVNAQYYLNNVANPNTAATNLIRVVLPEGSGTPGNQWGRAAIAGPRLE